MTLITPDVDILHEWDWQPACQAPLCESGRPPATHIAVLLKCDCPPAPICDPCTSILRHDILDNRYLDSKMCAGCHVWLWGYMRDWVRIEPLP